MVKLNLIRTNHHHTLISILLLLIISITVVSSQQYKQYEKQLVVYQCPYSQNKIQQYYQQQYDSSLAYGEIQRQLTLDQKLMAQWIFSDHNRDEDLADKVVKEIQGHLWEIVVYLGLFGVPVVITILSFPFLCCCCLCPETCSVCYTNRQSNTPSKLPIITLVTLPIIIIVALTTVLIISPSVHQLYDYTVCSYDMIMSDILNGTQSHDKEYTFVGLYGIKRKLVELNNTQYQLLGIIDPISSNGNITQQIFKQTSLILNSLSLIPNQTGSPLSITYNSPLNSATSTSQIQSTFPQILGTAKSPQQSLLSICYNSTSNFIYDNFTQIINLSDDIQNMIPDFEDQLTTAITDFDQQVSNIQDQRSITNILDGIGEYIWLGSLGFYGIIAIIVGSFVVMGITAVFIMFGKYGCRYCMYAMCVIIVIMAIIFVFTLGAAFSATTYSSFVTCKYIGSSLTNQQYFLDNLVPVFNVDPQYSTCIYGNGSLSFVNTFIHNSYIDEYLTDIEQINTYLNQFNTQQIINQLQASYQQLVPIVSDYMTAKRLDITTDVEILQEISNSSNYAECSSVLGFDDDSWVPSIHQNDQNNTVKCKIQAGEQSDFNTCQSIQNVENRADGCIGCMDSYDIIQKFNTYNNVYQMLNIRYPNCTRFAEQLGNIWVNFYQIKKQKISGVLQRTVQLTQQYDVLTQQLKSVEPIFKQVISQLEQSFDSILNPKYGLISGLNCRPFGDDAILMTQIFCAEYLPFSYNYRILFAVIAWSVLLLMCCTIHLGANAYRLSQRSRDYLLQQDDIEDIIVPNQSGQYYYRQIK